MILPDSYDPPKPDQPIPAGAKTNQASEVDVKTKKRHQEFKSRVETCKSYRRKLIPIWSTSIDMRRGKVFPTAVDEDQVAVNLDWSLTKSKQATLFSQVPQVRLDHAPDTLPKLAPWAAKFESRLNDTLREAGIESAMDECLPDCINAAGIGAILVSYEAITVDKQVPSIDLSSLPPQVQAQILQSGKFNGEPIPMETVPEVLDRKYSALRISPADLLWPVNFTTSSFDKSPWLGRSGRVTWAEGVQRFKLSEEDKEAICGEDKPLTDRLTHDTDRDKSSSDSMVGFDELFYWESKYDPEAKSYSAIHHLVFVNGKEDPVIDEPWKGQKMGEDGTLVGATKLPIRVLTLTYITDETIPPSDSAIGRPQVNEINKARTQMIRQRERSLPVRWFDVNRVDPSIQQGLMRGTWQAMIPVQGEGTRVIGEVARAQMPPENFLFDKIAKADLDQAWIGSSERQMAEAKGDPNQNLSSFNTQAGRERAKVASFFVGIAEVLGGLMCLYEDPSSFGEGFTPAAGKALKFSILADSTVLLDAGQKLSRLNQFINNYAKSGWVAIEPLLQEVATLTGLDPNVVIKAPQPKPPVEPNISLRLTGVEDLLNPLTLAFMIKSGQAPSPEFIEQAKQLIQQAVVMPQPPAPQDPNAPPGEGGAPGEGGVSPGGEQGQPGSAPQGPPIAPPQPGPPPGSPTPPPQPHKVGEAHPNWTTLTTLNKRTQGDEK